MEISVSEHTVTWLPMVVGVWFKVVEVREGSSMGVAHKKWEVRVTIINTVAFLTVHESHNVVFHYWALSHSGGGGSGDVASDSISESKDVFKSLVLEGKWVDINQTIRIG